LSGNYVCSSNSFYKTSVYVWYSKNLVIPLPSNANLM
jgi:hypothetical protein